MLTEYEMLTRCQHELKKCDIVEYERLLLEMNIIRVKIILLDDTVEVMSKSIVDRDSAIKDIYDQICNLCGKKGDHKKAREIATRLQNLIEDLKMH